MEKQWIIHVTVMCIVALVAIVGVTAMFMHGKAAESPGHARDLGSFCTDDNQCISGHCDGSILLPNGRTVPNVRVCT